MEELKQCPHCKGGGDPQEEEFTHQPSGAKIVGVRCHQCGSMSLSKDIWNTRAKPKLIKPTEPIKYVSSYFKGKEWLDSLE